MEWWDAFFISDSDESVSAVPKVDSGDGALQNGFWNLNAAGSHQLFVIEIRAATKDRIMWEKLGSILFYSFIYFQMKTECSITLNKTWARGRIINRLVLKATYFHSYWLFNVVYLSPFKDVLLASYCWYYYMSCVRLWCRSVAEGTQI